MEYIVYNTYYITILHKYEFINIDKNRQIEEIKRKMSSKLNEAEDHIEQSNSKINSLEKHKQRLTCEIEDLSSEIEHANANINSLDKKQKQYNKKPPACGPKE